MMNIIPPIIPPIIAPIGGYVGGGYVGGYVGGYFGGYVIFNLWHNFVIGCLLQQVIVYDELDIEANIDTLYAYISL